MKIFHLYFETFFLPALLLLTIASCGDRSANPGYTSKNALSGNSDPEAFIPYQSIDDEILYQRRVTVVTDPVDVDPVPGGSGGANNPPLDPGGDEPPAANPGGIDVVGDSFTPWFLGNGTVITCFLPGREGQVDAHYLDVLGNDQRGSYDLSRIIISNILPKNTDGTTHVVPIYFEGRMRLRLERCTVGVTQATYLSQAVTPATFSYDLFYPAADGSGEVEMIAHRVELVLYYQDL